MIKILLGILFLFLLIPNGFCQKTDYQSINRISVTRAVYTSNTLVKTGQGNIIRIEWLTTSNNGGFTVYDDTKPITAANVIAEGAQASATTSGTNDYSNDPLKFTNGLYLAIVGATVIITYQ